MASYYYYPLYFLFYIISRTKDHREDSIMYQLLSEKLQSLYEGDAYKFGDSKIHGQGLMANRQMKNGDIIDKATDPSLSLIHISEPTRPY